MEKFNFEKTREYENYVLEQSNKFLDDCDTYGEADNRLGLRTNVKNSVYAKSWIFELFENSPYHNGKGQLIIPMEIERPIDRDEIADFACYIEYLAGSFIFIPERELLVNGLSYIETKEKYWKLDKVKTVVEYLRIGYDEISIKSKSGLEYKADYDKINNSLAIFENNAYQRNGTYYELSAGEEFNKLYNISLAIRNCVGKNIENENDINRLSNQFPNCQVKEGVKITRLVLKLLKEMGIYQKIMDNPDKQKEFNKKYAAWCDAISPAKVKKWSVLSINFVDFLSMSNGSSWTSCLNVDKRRRFTSGSYSDGFNSRRVLDYALDPSTMVFYTVDENYDGDEFELQPKQTRQLFHFGEGKLVQGRLYPQGRVSRREIYTQYRENVEKLLADAMGEANLWSAPVRGMIDDYDDNIIELPYDYHEHGGFIDCIESACHGSEECDFQSEVNYVVFKGDTNRTDNGYPITVGSTNAVCIMCGEPMYEEYHNAIACYDCY